MLYFFENRVKSCQVFFANVGLIFHVFENVRLKGCQGGGKAINHTDSKRSALRHVWAYIPEYLEVRRSHLKADDFRKCANVCLMQAFQPTFRGPFPGC